MFPGAISSRQAQKIDSTPKPSVQPLARRGASQPMWTTQRFNRGVDGRRLAFLGAARRFSARCKPGVTDALLSAIYRRGVWKGTNASRTKILFFLPWEIGCVKTCKSVCHTAKPWELAALWLTDKKKTCFLKSRSTSSLGKSWFYSPVYDLRFLISIFYDKCIQRAKPSLFPQWHAREVEEFKRLWKSDYQVVGILSFLKTKMQKSRCFHCWNYVKCCVILFQLTLNWPFALLVMVKSRTLILRSLWSIIQTLQCSRVHPTNHVSRIRDSYQRAHCVKCSPSSFCERLSCCVFSELAKDLGQTEHGNCVWIHTKRGKTSCLPSTTIHTSVFGMLLI